ncbi:unnamed protein product [Moneuplotes crassus]|uniref:Uncharacterized protein n=1 Tax=Euplotes crassus TaxID=5936 RepID=A0AAD1XAV4_EUPCR|nr:unnamed protein product [Moneuplotes crassus]
MISISGVILCLFINFLVLVIFSYCFQNNKLLSLIFLMLPIKRGSQQKECFIELDCAYFIFPKCGNLVYLSTLMSSKSSFFFSP